jgi:hypothetical protein
VCEPNDDHIRLKHVGASTKICADFELNIWLCLTEFLIFFYLLVMLGIVF